MLEGAAEEGDGLPLVWGGDAAVGGVLPALVCGVGEGGEDAGEGSERRG